MSQFAFGASPTIQLSVSSVGADSASAPPTTTSAGSSSSSGGGGGSGANAGSTSGGGGGARSVSPSSVTSGGPPSGPVAGGGSTTRCCDTGRPVFADPITGQTVCSCQYDLLSYQRLATAGVTAPGLPALSMYSTPYSEGMAAYFPLGADQAPFYTQTAAGLELKENLAAGAGGWPYPSVYHPYDAAFAGYPFNGYGMDLNGARRKNATRETTSTLKAWLNDHKKNPYPTKGEKIMLAIITKMTLTQVSTWFANARRRLKKENKMTWEPRNRVEDEDNNNDDDGGRKSADNAKDPDSKDSGTGSSEDGDRSGHRLELLDRPLGGSATGSGPGSGPGAGGGGGDTGSEWSESRPDSGPDSPECLFERPTHLLHPAYHGHTPPPPPPPPVTVKPRIWSLADMASKESDHTSTPLIPPTPAAPAAFYASPVGKLISPLANHHRGALGHPAHHLHGAYVPRPPGDFYSRFYGPALHLPGGSGGPPGPDLPLLENYSRSFLGNGVPGGGGVVGIGTSSSVPAVTKVAPSSTSSTSSSSGSLVDVAKSSPTEAQPSKV